MTMIREIIFILILVGIALITAVVEAQPVQEQWPPVQGRYSASNINYRNFDTARFPSSIRSQSSGTDEYGWRNNYVNPNYNPYANQLAIGYSRQQRGDRYLLVAPYYARTYSGSYIGTNVGYHLMATSSFIPMVGNSLLMSPSMMNYTPWAFGYGMTQMMTAPFLPVPGLIY